MDGEGWWKSVQGRGNNLTRSHFYPELCVYICVSGGWWGPGSKTLDFMSLITMRPLANGLFTSGHTLLTWKSGPVIILLPTLERLPRKVLHEVSLTYQVIRTCCHYRMSVQWYKLRKCVTKGQAGREIDFLWYGFSYFLNCRPHANIFYSKITKVWAVISSILV